MANLDKELIKEALLKLRGDIKEYISELELRAKRQKVNTKNGIEYGLTLSESQVLARHKSKLYRIHKELDKLK